MEGVVKNASEAAEALGTTLTVWGTPTAGPRQLARMAAVWQAASKKPQALYENLEEKNPKPYLTMPTYCSESLSPPRRPSRGPAKTASRLPLAPRPFVQPLLVGAARFPSAPN